MYQLKSVNLDDLWQKDQGWDAERKSGRKFDDRAELEFWDKLAPTYSRQYNLYRDSVPLRDKLKEVFGEGKKIIDNYDTSSICMFRIANIEEINKISRELGNKVITEVSNYIKNNISDTYLFVRYMGPKFVIVFCGVDSEAVSEFINSVRGAIENLNISLENNFEVKELTELKEDENADVEQTKKVKRRRKKKIQSATPQLNFIISTYYKGTGLEEVLGKMEAHMDQESNKSTEISSI